MSDQNVTTTTDQVSETAPSAKPDEHMIPKSRFDEINTERLKLAAQLDELEKVQKAEIERRLQEQERWKELAEKRAADLAEAQGKAAQVDAYEATLNGLLEKEVGAIPEDKRGLIPDYGTTQQKLQWIGANRTILAAPQPFAIGAGKQGAGENIKINLSPEQVEIARRFGMTPEEYAKNNT